MFDKHDNGYTTIVAILAMVACLCAGIFLYGKLATYHTQASVTDLTWQRVIRVERYQQVQDDSLRSSVPSDAYDISYYTHTWYESATCARDVYAGTDSKGKVQYRSETYECGSWESEDRAKYTVDRWRPDYAIQSSGTVQDDRRWPWFTPSAGTWLGAIREASREEFLLVAFKTDSLALSYRAKDDTDWHSYAVGQAYELDINRFNEPLWETVKLVDRR